MPKIIRGKDFHRNVGKSILMPHPTNQSIMPVKLKIIMAHKQRVTLKNEETGESLTTTYSTDKNKYLVVE